MLFRVPKPASLYPKASSLKFHLPPTSPRCYKTLTEVWGIRRWFWELMR